MLFNALSLAETVGEHLETIVKDWNKTGKAKTAILGILCLPNLIIPIPPVPNMGVAVLVAPLIFGSVAVPVILNIDALLFGRIIEKPNWNDNPFRLSKPLIFNQFAALFFVSVGLSMTIGTLIKFHQLNYFGLTAVSFGIGILTGIQVLLRMTPNREKK